MYDRASLQESIVSMRTYSNGSTWQRQYLSQHRIDGQRGNVGDCRWSSGDSVILCGFVEDCGVLRGRERCIVRLANRGSLVDGARSLVDQSAGLRVTWS